MIVVNYGLWCTMALQSAPAFTHLLSKQTLYTTLIAKGWVTENIKIGTENPDRGYNSQSDHEG